MLKQEKGSSPQRGKPGSQSATGKQGGKGVATGNDTNQNGVFQYALIRLSVAILLFFCGKFMRLKTFYALKQLLNQSRPKGWTKKRFSFLSYVKRILSKTLAFPFTFWDVYEGSKKTGVLFDMNRIDDYQMQNFGYMLMSMPLASHVITAVIKPPRSYADKAIIARSITVACSGNIRIPIPALTITAYLLALDDLDAAILACKTRTLGTVPIRNADWIIVYNNLKAMMAVAQAGANSDQSQAIAIIESGLFKVKMVSGHGKRLFTAVNGADAGTANLSASGAPSTGMHQWQQSLDGIIYKELQDTRLSKTTVIGLIPVSKVWFRHRIVDGNVFGAWEYYYLVVTG